jgi:small subunit ribosomal protein S6
MAKQRKHLYEGMYILSATLSDDARQKALEKITTGITGRGGEIHKVFDQGRKKLAYEINGKREGHYFLLYFSAPTNNLAEIWREYHLNEDLVRFLTLRTEVVPEKIEFKQLIQE